MFLTTICLLLIVILPGVGVKLLGARRWINLGFFSFQPSEVAKLTLGIYFSFLLTQTGRFKQFVGSLGLAVFLIMLQPDLGTAALITFTSFVVYFGSGGSLAKLFFLGLIGVILAVSLVLISPYRFSRLTTFLDYSRDPQGASYQIHQALIALGSGGIFGVGLGQSRQKFDYLPEATTDSIFAIIGEELGLAGTVGLVIVFFTLVVSGLAVARSAPPGFSANLALATTSLVAVQAFINISSLTALLPLTGIPLSFISYGGSSLVTMLAATGILVNIAKTYGK
jgi:cell division protein FtsW